MNRIKETSIKIDRKTNLDYWIQHRSSLPKEILYIYDLNKEELPEKFTFALTADTTGIYSHHPGHLIFFLENIKQKYIPKEQFPVFEMNNLESMIFAKDFINNKVYGEYTLHFINPEVKMLDFCHRERCLAPYATPNSAP